MAIGNSTGGGWKYFHFHPDSTVFNHSGTTSGTGVDVIKAALFASTTAEYPSGAGCLSNWDFVVSRVLSWADGTSDPDPCAASTGDTTGGDTTGGDTTGGDTTDGDPLGGDPLGGDPLGGPLGGPSSFQPCTASCYYDNDGDGVGGAIAGPSTGIEPVCTCASGQVLTSGDADDNDDSIQ